MCLSEECMFVWLTYVCDCSVHVRSCVRACVRACMRAISRYREWVSMGEDSGKIGTTRSLPLTGYDSAKRLQIARNRTAQNTATRAR